MSPYSATTAHSPPPAPGLPSLHPSPLRCPLSTPHPSTAHCPPLTPLLSSLHPSLFRCTLPLLISQSGSCLGPSCSSSSPASLPLGESLSGLQRANLCRSAGTQTASRWRSAPSGARTRSWPGYQQRRPCCCSSGSGVGESSTLSEGEGS